MITVREAVAADVEAIRDIFFACYGRDYPYQQFYDLDHLRKTVYSDDTLIIVAEDQADGRILGTASVILEVGAYSELVGEFGRLAVLPETRNRGVGKLLMTERLARVSDRLHVGIIDGRVAHPFTLKIAEGQGFSVVGFEPLKMLIARRESLALLVRHFGVALELRRNHPRVIPEVFPLAHLALEHCRMPVDVIVDEESAPYPYDGDFEIEDLSTEGYAHLLRIERGRVKNREVFGPTRLHYGFFKIQVRKSRYLIAREEGRIVGAVGFTNDPVERVVRIFELIALHDHVGRFLLSEIERLSRTDWNVAFISIDVSAHAPRMQRTLFELGFLPVAYIPALSFVEVERIDVVRMARLLAPLELDDFQLSPAAKEIADVVIRGFTQRRILPRIAEAVQRVALFDGLNGEQIQRLAGAFRLRSCEAGATIFAAGEAAKELYILLSGDASVYVADRDKPVGLVRAGECLGEVGVLNRTTRSATVRAGSPIEAAVVEADALHELVRQRPDIGLMIFKNLARGLGEKLRRTSKAEGAPGPCQPIGKGAPS